MVTCAGETPDDDLNNGLDIPDSEGTPDDHGIPEYNHKRTKSGERKRNHLHHTVNSQSWGEEADGLVMNALQVVIQSVKDQNTIIRQQIEETSKMGAVIDNLRQETKTRQEKLETKIADINKLTGKINLLTQKVRSEARTGQKILEDKIDGLNDILNTSRTQEAEDNGKEGWRSGEAQPLNPESNTPRKNTKGENQK